MGLVAKVVDAFILTGITPLSPSKRRTATVFIAAGLFGTVVGIVVLALLLTRHLPRSH